MFVWPTIQTRNLSIVSANVTRTNKSHGILGTNISILQLFVPLRANILYNANVDRWQYYVPCKRIENIQDFNSYVAAKF